MVTYQKWRWGWKQVLTGEAAWTREWIEQKTSPAGNWVALGQASTTPFLYKQHSKIVLVNPWSSIVFEHNLQLQSSPEHSSVNREDSPTTLITLGWFPQVFLCTVTLQQHLETVLLLQGLHNPFCVTRKSLAVPGCSEWLPGSAPASCAPLPASALSGLPQLTPFSCSQGRTFSSPPSWLPPTPSAAARTPHTSILGPPALLIGTVVSPQNSQDLLSLLCDFKQERTPEWSATFSFFNLKCL